MPIVSLLCVFVTVTAICLSLTLVIFQLFVLSFSYTAVQSSGTVTSSTVYVLSAGRLVHVCVQLLVVLRSCSQVWGVLTPALSGSLSGMES